MYMNQLLVPGHRVPALTAVSSPHCGGQSTVVVAVEVTVAWLVALADAVFGYALQLAVVVGLLTLTVASVPLAISPKLQPSTPAVIVHGLPAGCELIDHTMPLPVGRGSLSVTPVAVPGPLLLTLIEKLIGEPAVTVAAPAVFKTVRLGQLTVVDAVDVNVA
jgi:hypothetical protein